MKGKRKHFILKHDTNFVTIEEVQKCNTTIMGYPINIIIEKPSTINISENEINEYFNTAYKKVENGV